MRCIAPWRGIWRPSPQVSQSSVAETHMGKSPPGSHASAGYLVSPFRDGVPEPQAAQARAIRIQALRGPFIQIQFKMLCFSTCPRGYPMQVLSRSAALRVPPSQMRRPLLLAPFRDHVGVVLHRTPGSAASGRSTRGYQYSAPSGLPGQLSPIRVKALCFRTCPRVRTMYVSTSKRTRPLKGAQYC